MQASGLDDRVGASSVAGVTAEEQSVRISDYVPSTRGLDTIEIEK